MTATKPIRTAIVAVFAVVAIAASCAGAGEVAMQHPETGRKDVPAVTVIYRNAAVVFGSYATPGGVPAWDPLWGVNPDKPDVEGIVAKYPDQFAVEFTCAIASLRMLLMCSSNDGVKSSQTTE